MKSVLSSSSRKGSLRMRVSRSRFLPSCVSCNARLISSSCLGASHWKLYGSKCVNTHKALYDTFFVTVFYAGIQFFLMRVVSFPLSVETDFMNIVCAQPLSLFVAYHRTDVSMCHGDHAHAVVYPCCRVEAEGVSLLHLCGERQAYNRRLL